MPPNPSGLLTTTSSALQYNMTNLTVAGTTASVPLSATPPNISLSTTSPDTTSDLTIPTMTETGRRSFSNQPSHILYLHVYFSLLFTFFAVNTLSGSESYTPGPDAMTTPVPTQKKMRTTVGNAKPEAPCEFMITSRRACRFHGLSHTPLQSLELLCVLTVLMLCVLFVSFQRAR